jgi:hypothetical protein
MDAAFRCGDRWSVRGMFRMLRKRPGVGGGAGCPGASNVLVTYQSRQSQNQKAVLELSKVGLFPQKGP